MFDFLRLTEQKFCLPLNNLRQSFTEHIKDNMKKHFAFVLLFALILFSQRVSAQQDPYRQVELLLKTSRQTEALIILDSLEKSGNNTPVLAYYRANSYLALQRYEETISLCSGQISKLGSKDTLLPHFYFVKSLACDYTGNRDLAIQNLNKAIKLNPKKVTYYINASFYYGEKGDYKTCLANLQKAIKIEPENIAVLNNLSYYSSMNKQYAKGLEYANRGMKLISDNQQVAILLNNRGFAYLGMKNYDAATNDIMDALRLYPENPYAYFNKALLYMHLGNEAAVCENLQLATFYGYIYSLEELSGKYCK